MIIDHGAERRPNMKRGSEKRPSWLIFVLIAAAALAGAFLPYMFERTTDGERGASVPLSVAEGPQPPVHVIDDGAVYELRAAPVSRAIGGKKNAMMAYNGSIPGPTLRVRQGSVVTVRFTNDLDEPTTVHWHGVRVENAFDGVPDVTQEAVPPGGEFTYRLRFPDAGVFWYHPHVREDKQQELGLYGNIIVEPADPEYWPAAAKEEVLILDDILMANGFIAPFFDDLVDHALMGRFGNVMLLNGGESTRLVATAGEPVRYFVTNVANTRPFALVIAGAEMTLVGADAGRFEEPRSVDPVLLLPSERAVLQVIFPRPGTYAIEHRTPSRTYSLGEVVVSSGDAMKASIPAANDDMASIRPHLSRPVDATWRLDVDMSHMMPHLDSGDPIEWEDDMPMMNAHMTDASTAWKIIDVESGRTNMDIDARWRTGDHVKIRIVNDLRGAHPMQHPIHLHGQRFVIAEIDGRPNDDLVWKDTVLVPRGSVVDIVVELTNPGEWMAHCHIAEHLHAGMMTGFTVEGEDLVTLD